MFAGCFVDDRQVPSVVALNKDELQVLDTWHTLGLRGTGSHDCVADDVFVPADRVFSVFDGPIVDRPLYRFPVFGFFALSIGAAALGNARAAIDDLVELAGGKKGLGSTRPWRNVRRPKPRRQPPSRRWAPPAPCSTR